MRPDDSIVTKVAQDAVKNATASSEIKLLPCPFCGSSGDYYDEGRDSAGCSNKGCPAYDISFHPEQWNTRHPSLGYPRYRFQKGSKWMRQVEGVKFMRPIKISDLNRAIVKRWGIDRSQGFLDACNIVNEMYSRSSTHPHLIGDCVLAKINLIRSNKRIRKNPFVKPTNPQSSTMALTWREKLAEALRLKI